MTQLSEKIFNEKMNQAVVHEALRWYLASRRQGTHSALTRAEVSGGGKKPWKQKGTGRARAGSNRSPLWRKGGVIFPPKPRDYSYALPKKMRKLALRIVLSELNRDGKVRLIESFTLPEAKARAGAKFLADLKAGGNVIILMGAENPAFERGVRNLAGVTVVLIDDINVYNLAKADWLLLDAVALGQLKERMA
ncbi:50S ribosomal protein L4 [candidate division WOR-1 bacterium RIFCSPHIGHO2_01_FULL_53_15]|uniref:Large ribosomal subunit protein uL4 n=1 Tax=candidate division WOR-1 bacterium RIFCSPHIGHO2_01_FULL_53_15 TaxID=1802564 RepID=A0A1F4Q3Y0_UNCSA|nr:MAG: 50S ribosomal protein L4 [candidate division WOR-1 bacterium RIFCSPHIGHO2_01_FULL_53_15]OGC12514.1 MAG: 50S ribosomal protein L4 [candidate division WOR-1 bacterium RIFCSPHIGHO2_02_FULL_53_26]